jgi:molecular chaperone GrpE
VGDGEPTDFETDVRDRLTALEDLFRRRLLDDRDKRRAFDVLYERLESAERARAGDHVLPLVRPLLLLLDRLDGHDSDDGFASSIRDELLEILRQNGVEEIEVAADFDPKLCEIVQVRDADALSGDGVEVRRRGFRLGARVIRPSQIIISRDVDEVAASDAQRG